jgi:hypothetical protein
MPVAIDVDLSGLAASVGRRVPTVPFLDLEKRIEPHAGMALLFQHRLLHEGSEVTSGVKYVVRSDVMYRTRVNVEHEQ